MNKTGIYKEEGTKHKMEEDKMVTKTNMDESHDGLDQTTKRHNQQYINTLG